MNLADEYTEKFGEPIPFYQIPADWDSERLEYELKKAIETGEPLKVDESKETIY